MFLESINAIDFDLIGQLAATIDIRGVSIITDINTEKC